MNEFEKYCKIEGLNAYEVTSSLPGRRSLREKVSDATLRVVIEAPQRASRAWFRVIDTAHHVAQTYPKLRFMDPKFPWSDPSLPNHEAQLRIFLNEKARAVPDSLYDEMISIASESSDAYSKELVGQLMYNREQFNATLELALREFPNSSLLSIGINALLMLGGSRPEYLPAIAPLGAALAQTNVNNRANLGDAMNISLRDVFITSYLVQRFADLYSYGEMKVDLSKDVDLAGGQMLPVFNALIDDFESNGIIPGALIGSIGSAALGDKGVAGAIILGTVAATKAILTYDRKKNENFGKWFAESRKEQINDRDAALADPAIAQEKIDQMYARSRQMADYIHGHNRISAMFAQVFPWGIQTVSAYLSWVTGVRQNLALYLLAGKAGASEQQKMIRKVSLYQNLQTIEKYQEKIRSTFESIANFRQALKLIGPHTYAETLSDALSTNIEYDHETGTTVIHRFVNAAMHLKEIGDIQIVRGIHHLVGESGAGKSSLLNYLKLYLSENGISYTYASVESETNESVGFKMAKILSEGKNERILRYFRETIHRTETDGILNRELMKEFAEIRGIEQDTAVERFDIVASNILSKTYTNPKALWNEWKQSYQDKNGQTISEEMAFLNALAVNYFKEKVGIKKRDILTANGSTGETRRALLALIDLDAEFIILDEVISNVDPQNIATMINYLADELNGELSDKTLILVAHEPEVLRTFKRVTPEHIDQHVTVLYPDVQITESFDQRFIQGNFEEDLQGMHDAIILSITDNLRAVLRRGYQYHEQLDSAFFGILENVNINFVLTLDQKWKLATTMMEYRDYIASMNLTDLQRYYLAGAVHSLNSQFGRNAQNEIEQDAFYRQIVLIGTQMQVAIPQCITGIFIGWDASEYLDNTVYRTVPNHADVGKVETLTIANDQRVRSEAIINAMIANFRKLPEESSLFWTVEDNIFDALKAITGKMNTTFYDGESHHSFIKEFEKFLERLKQGKLMTKYFYDIKVIVDALERWATYIPEFEKQVIRLDQDLVAILQE